MSMVHVIRYTFGSVFRGTQDPAAPPEEPRLVLHAGPTGMYWLMIFGAVNGLALLPRGLLHLWREGGVDRSGVIVFGVVATAVLTLAIAYCQRKARWLVAAPSGLTVTDRTTVRKVPWREVRTIMDLGYLGGGPLAKRYHIEFADGSYFTFLGDPDAMKRLEQLRPTWKKEDQ